MIRDAVWRENLERDADKLGLELTRRRFLGIAGSALAIEYVGLRRAYATSLRGGAAIPTGVTEITNARTGARYRYVAEALYTAETADEIILPAGDGAHYRGAYVPYASWQQLDSSYLRYTANDGWDTMYLGPRYSRAKHLSIVGSPSATSPRAVISRPFAHLVADFRPGATAMELDNVALFTPPHAKGSHTGGLFVWGDGSTVSLQLALRRGAGQMGYTGIDTTRNYLTGIKDGPAFTIPAGTRITLGQINGQAPFFAAAPNPGISFTNLELWGSASWSGTVNAIRMASTPPGSPGLGSITVTGCYFHDNQQGTGLGYAPIGSGVFAHFFDTELYQEGYPDGRTHNLYIGSVDEVILHNVYSHKTNGTQLIKTRARAGYINFNCIRGERTDENKGEIESCNIDICNGGLYYVIGNQLQQSLNAANQMINFCAEGGNAASGGAPNSKQELYLINNTGVGPANGTGYRGSGAGNAAVKVNQEGIQYPALPRLSAVRGGDLPPRVYVAQVTAVASDGGETTGSPFVAANGSARTVAILPVRAGELLEVNSIASMTGAAAYNVYANYADPPLFTAMRYPVGQQGTLWFWDAAHKLPIFGQTPGGDIISATGELQHGSALVGRLNTLDGISVGHSVYVAGRATGLAVRSIDGTTSSITLNGAYRGGSERTELTFGDYLYCGFTYQFPTGESANLALLGMSYQGLSGSKLYYDGAGDRVSSPFYNAALFQVDPGMRLVVKAPPSGPRGATGINFYCAPTAYNPQGGWAVTTLTKQNTSTIGFGTAWTAQSSSLIQSAVLQPNITLQNPSPVSIGAKWQEPKDGLKVQNLKSDRLQWRRRAQIDAAGATVEEWWAPVTLDLRDHVITIYYLAPVLYNVSVAAIKGAANPTWPFDAGVPAPVTRSATPCSVTVRPSTARSFVVAAFSANNGTHRIRTSPGFTPIFGGSGRSFMSEFKVLRSSQTLTIIEGTGSTNEGDAVIADIISLSDSDSVVGERVTASGRGRTAKLRISADAGDVLILQMNVKAVAVDPGGPPVVSTATSGSPIIRVQNCLLANFNATATGGVLVSSSKSYPSGALTLRNNLLANPYNGSTFGKPTWATVFAEPQQARFDYRLASRSPAIGAGSNPGSSPEGRSLAAVYENQINDLPRPGSPIPRLKARRNSSWDQGAFESEARKMKAQKEIQNSDPLHPKDKK